MKTARSLRLRQGFGGQAALPAPSSQGEGEEPDPSLA